MLPSFTPDIETNHCYKQTLTHMSVVLVRAVLVHLLTRLFISTAQHPFWRDKCTLKVKLTRSWPPSHPLLWQLCFTLRLAPSSLSIYPSPPLRLLHPSSTNPAPGPISSHLKKGIFTCFFSYSLPSLASFPHESGSTRLQVFSPNRNHSSTCTFGLSSTDKVTTFIGQRLWLMWFLFTLFLYLTKRVFHYVVSTYACMAMPHLKLLMCLSEVSPRLKDCAGLPTWNFVYSLQRPTTASQLSSNSTGAWNTSLPVDFLHTPWSNCVLMCVWCVIGTHERHKKSKTPQSHASFSRCTEVTCAGTQTNDSVHTKGNRPLKDSTDSLILLIHKSWYLMETIKAYSTCIFSLSLQYTVFVSTPSGVY